MKIRKFLTRVIDTQEDEILCSECLEAVDQFVDMEMENLPAAEKFPLLKQHLDQCSVCQEEYELLRALAEGSPDVPSSNDR